MFLELSLWYWIGLFGLILAGAAIWFGWWRSWVDHPRLQYYAWRIPGGPWIALAMTVVAVDGTLQHLGFDSSKVVPEAIMLYVVAVLSIIGLSVMAFHWPRWALPPWYRKLMLERNGPSPPRPWWLKWIDW
ncbi:MAG: hypothetical protein EPO21_16850 [Chloroflexota bacterium]|nr:MAG: hypothetical protein EPO21_16850 [Chloroflexota bacterium]